MSDLTPGIDPRIATCLDCLAYLSAEDVHVSVTETTIKVGFRDCDWDDIEEAELRFKVIDHTNPEHVTCEYIWCNGDWYIRDDRALPDGWCCISDDALDALNELGGEFDKLKYDDPLEQFNTRYPGAWSDPDEQ
jgi:hypothetical protein